MDVFTRWSWSCSPSAARLCRQYRHVLLWMGRMGVSIACWSVEFSENFRGSSESRSAREYRWPDHETSDRCQG
jgi:hypothetical protein